MKTLKHIVFVCILLTFATGSPVKASLNLVGSGNYLGPNLVVNGSFESGHPGPGMANYQYWAAGTLNTPFLAIPGWTGTGQPQTYAVWGSDENSGPFHTRSSAPLPDGQIGVYFGNGGHGPGQQINVDMAPTFNSDFTVSFSGNPTFSIPFGGPATLSQTIPTHLSPAPMYGLSFWTSGEGALFGSGDLKGIFAMRLSNTLPGDPLIYLWCPPGGSSLIGASHVFQFEFTPLNASLPVTLELINFGHLDLNAYGGAFFTTELVVDDVRMVQLPEPTTLTLLFFGALAYRLVARGKRRNH